MKYDAKEFKKYPEIMNKEQMRIACHISKQTALYLLQFNLIPHTCTGKKTRCYAIKKSDVIAFMNDREVNPEKYIAPKNWYKYGSEMVRPYKIRIHPPCGKDEKKLRRYYESKLAALPDVMDVAAAVDFTGYNRRTVCQWIRVGKLKALALLQKYMIPKCYLIDWLCSDDYNNTNRKSRRHIDCRTTIHIGQLKKKAMRNMVSWVIVKLPHQTSPKGDHIPHEQEYNTRHGLSAIPNEVRREIRRQPRQPEVQQEPVVHLLLEAALGW